MPERLIRVFYPSIGSRGLGRLIGRVLESIPIRVGVAKVSHLLFALPLAPLGASLYVALKVIGRRYRLTDRAVHVEHALGGEPYASIRLEDIDDIVRVDRPGYVFFDAADLTLKSADGVLAVKLKAVVRPDTVTSIIGEARDAARETSAAVAQVRNRAS
ncbi:MAG: hypothetical protein AAF532_01395 [Planctomycetota bacterium]